MKSEPHNCLAGVRCPDCGQAEGFYITAMIMAYVTDDGADIASGSSMEWDETSMTICPECDRYGPHKDFQLEEGE